MENLTATSKIEDLQLQERPRERLAKMGANVLSTAELLAIPGFENAFQRAIEQAENGDTVSFEAIRRDV